MQNRQNDPLKQMTLAVTTLFLLAVSGARAAPEANGAEDLPFKYTGNTFSLKFHRPSCRFARRMWRQHVRRFHFRYQAIDEGLAPCRYCLPPRSTSVHAQLLMPKDEGGDLPNPDASVRESLPLTPSGVRLERGGQPFGFQ